MITESASRREFLLKWVTWAGLGATGTILAWVFGSVWTAASRFSSHRWVHIAPLDRFSTDTVTPFPEYKLAVIRSPRGLGAISIECTHLGCIVDTVDRGFFCPCHGSQFGPLGQVYSGPATVPLPWYRLIKREGMIWVHLGTKLPGPVWLALEGPTGASAGRG